MDVVKSKNSIPDRHTDERWIHIVENHDDLAGYFDEIRIAVESPDYIIKGYREALITLKRIKEEKFLAIVNKEISKSNGFVITAYFTRKIKLEKEEIVWQQPK